MGCQQKDKEDKRVDRKLKTNWKIYDLAMKQEDEWFIQQAKEIIDEMLEPWKQSKMGRPPKHPPKSLVLVLLLKPKHQKSYRGLESFLREGKRYKQLGFTSPPGKSTLQEAMAKVPEEYLEGIEEKLSAILKNEKYLAVDSTGYSTNKYESWFNVRTGEESKRREFKKSHMIVGYWYKGILSHEVTLGHHHDSPVFPILMGKLPSGDYDNMRVIQGTAAGITVIWFQRKA